MLKGPRLKVTEFVQQAREGDLRLEECVSVTQPTC